MDSYIDGIKFMPIVDFIRLPQNNVPKNEKKTHLTILSCVEDYLTLPTPLY